jgi:HEPN domain-containing protein
MAEAKGIFESWVNQGRKDLVRADRGAIYEDWEQVVYYCQQALEKLAKVVFLLYVNKDIPFIHNVEIIFRKLESNLPEPVGDKRYALLTKIPQFYINGRYLCRSGEMLFSVDKTEAENILAQTKEVFEWLLKSLAQPAAQKSSDQTPSEPSNSST